MREMVRVPPLAQLTARLSAQFPACAAAAAAAGLPPVRQHAVWPTPAAPGALPVLPAAPWRQPAAAAQDLPVLALAPALAQREVVLRVAVYPADDRVHRHSAVMRSQQEFEVLGSTPLIALRDAISCARDHASDTPGAMFYVEGVCYNDTRATRAPALAAAAAAAAAQPAPVPSHSVGGRAEGGVMAAAAVAAQPALLNLLLHSIGSSEDDDDDAAAAGSRARPSGGQRGGGKRGRGERQPRLPPRRRCQPPAMPCLPGPTPRCLAMCRRGGAASTAGPWRACALAT